MTLSESVSAPESAVSDRSPCPQAFHGHQANLINLMAVTDDVGLRDGRGRTALHLAAARGHLACVQSLLEQKVGDTDLTRLYLCTVTVGTSVRWIRYNLTWQ